MDPLLISRLFLFALATPAFAALLGLLLRRVSWSNTLTQVLFALSGLVGLGAVALLALEMFAGSLSSLQIGGLGVLQPLGVPFLGIIYAGVLLTSFYSIAALAKYKEIYVLPWLNVASALFLIGMQAVVLAPSVLTFLLAWELMSIAAYFLVIADRTEDSLRAGFLYFVMTHLGFLALAAGLLILSGGNPLLSWAELAQGAATLGALPLSLAFALLFAGFGSKAGLVPLHQWLPYAHPQAPSGSSALLSGVMLKVAVFGFLQSLTFFPSLLFPWMLVVLLLGLVSAFFGALHAAVENDAKRLLAWSSIENMGLIFAGIALYFLTSGTAALAPLAPLFALFVMLHILNHFLFKSGLFMAAGVIQSATHTRDLDSLGGLARRWPLFSGVVLALSLAAAALPPLGTFFGEWALVQALALGLGAGDPASRFTALLVLSSVALVGGLAIFAFVKFFSLVFLGRARTEAAEHAGALSWILATPVAICALLSLGVGLVAFPLISGIPVGKLFGAEVVVAPGAGIDPTLVALILAAPALALWLITRVLRTKIRITDTWDCGAPLTPRMQYTSTGFAAPIRFFFRTLLGARREIITTPVVASNPWVTKKHLDWQIHSIWEVWLYKPLGHGIVRVAHSVRRLQSGVVQFYLLLVLLTLILTLFIAL
ncbi:MAG: hypothetical protein HYS26_04180 [Candidatus Kaiserbacteria bacterium]|nr:MAG: hypothetical protein HYS26_04180 [Candidatus Kaiserbacteria bacterium]